MGIGDAGILAVNTDIQTVFLDMIAEMVDEDSLSLAFIMVQM